MRQLHLKLNARRVPSQSPAYYRYPCISLAGVKLPTIIYAVGDSRHANLACQIRAHHRAVSAGWQYRLAAKIFRNSLVAG
jgi:hypothetical protein